MIFNSLKIRRIKQKKYEDKQIRLLYKITFFKFPNLDYIFIINFSPLTRVIDRIA